MSTPLVIVTASTNPRRAGRCLESWGDLPIIVVLNGVGGDADARVAETTIKATWIASPDYLGTVPAFRLGVDYALETTDAEIICCLHDDLEIYEPDWAEKVVRAFQQYPATGLAGFGGAIGLGDADLYQKPYEPVQLARVGFRSNLIDAETHGMRSLLSERVACLDGFSQIGRRAFWEGFVRRDVPYTPVTKPWSVLEQGGVTHHLYDGLLGALAARYGWEVRYLPIRCKHYGGQTAVGDIGYATWAKRQHAHGDHGFWEDAHKWGYENFRDVLPIRV